MDPQIDRQVVGSVLKLLETKGYRHVTFERLARIVKRARTTLYRRWPSKRHLIAYVVVNTLGAEPAPDTGSVREDLISAVDTLRQGFEGPLGRALPGLLADMAHDPLLARLIREDVLGPRRRSIREALLRGVERGELRAGGDLEMLIDLLTAPCYFRAIFGHARITRSFVERAVDHVLAAAGPPATRR